MSREEIITTTEGYANAPLGRYEFQPEAGSLIGTLAYRAWHPTKACLICFFDTDNGEYYKLTAWWDKSYKPKNSDTSFADNVINGSRWKCEYRRTKKGYMSWLTAEQMP